VSDLSCFCAVPGRVSCIMGDNMLGDNFARGVGGG